VTKTPTEKEKNQKVTHSRSESSSIAPQYTNFLRETAGTGRGRGAQGDVVATGENSKFYLLRSRREEKRIKKEGTNLN